MSSNRCLPAPKPWNAWRSPGPRDRNPNLGSRAGRCGSGLNRSQWYLGHAQVIVEREVLVAVPAHVSDGVGSLALPQEVARGELWRNGRRAEDWDGRRRKGRRGNTARQADREGDRWWGVCVLMWERERERERAREPQLTYWEREREREREMEGGKEFNPERKRDREDNTKRKRWGEGENEN